MEKRNEQQWRALFDSAVLSIIGGRCANSYFGDYSIDSIISEAIREADTIMIKCRLPFFLFSFVETYLFNKIS